MTSEPRRERNMNTKDYHGLMFTYFHSLDISISTLHLFPMAGQSVSHRSNGVIQELKK